VNTPPIRGELPPDVLRAARMISPVVWRERYIPGRGPLHYAGGLSWPNSLRMTARRWRRLADAAEVCAGWIETTEAPGRVLPAAPARSVTKEELARRLREAEADLEELRQQMGVA
jgi:hypothetical protein